MNCPDPDELRALLRGAGNDQVAAHVEACSACQAALGELTQPPDGLEQQLRQAGREAPFGEDECRRALAAVEGFAPPAGPSAPPAASADSSTTTLTPRQLGKYLLLQPIGELSGQGVVWQARESDTGRECAIKVLRADRNGPYYLERFRREIRTLVTQLKDPNIVLAYDAGEQDGEFYLVMELLDGLSLAEVLLQHGRLALADACEIVCQAATGLHVAHRAGLVHRDVKPGNLFLTREGKVKVLDLGLVRLLEDDGDLTQPGLIMGSAQYMAPEQVADSRQVDARSDLYSLGCVLYRLLADSFPYAVTLPGDPDRRRQAMLNAHRTEPLVPIRSLRPDVPEKLARVLDRLLARRREDRFASAAEVITAVRPLLPPRHHLRHLLGEGPAGGSVVPPALHADLDVLLWDGDHRRHRSIREPGTLPLHTGDRYQVEVCLSRPAYVYVLWLDTEGQVLPLYPWRPGTWELLAGEAPCAHLLLPLPDPAHSEQPWTLGGPAGMETVVLLVEDAPRRDIPELLARGLPGPIPLSALGEPARSYWFSCRREELGAGQRGPNLAGKPHHDPIFQVHSFLRRRLGPHVGVVQAVSFANLGPEGGTT
jgi:serine/threonine protein kinase